MCGTPVSVCALVEMAQVVWDDVSTVSVCVASKCILFYLLCACLDPPSTLSLHFYRSIMVNVQ